jgi:putative DNA primase/helicase
MSNELSRPATAEAQKTFEEERKKVNGDDQIATLAQLSPITYDQRRKGVAKELRIRVSTLDGVVANARGDEDNGNGGGAITFAEVEPWPEWVDGAELLNDVAQTINSYSLLPEHGDTVFALWTAHAHAFKAFVHSPRLNITAPVKGCGKTVTMDVLETLSPHPQRTENLSTAVLFRLVDKYRPTLLIDEYDAFLKDNEQLRGALNAGHKRGGIFLRCEGDAHEIRAFNVFAPVALAGIGALPGTLQDRSIVIRMKRAKKGEITKRFDSRRTGHEAELNRKLARWAGDHFDELEAADPALPEGAFNRVADNWRPLFAIAELAGGKWPERVRTAFAAFAGGDEDDDSLGVRLLGDLRDLFEGRKLRPIGSTELAEVLAKLEERPWAEFPVKHGPRKPVTTRQISDLLRPFSITSKDVRIGERSLKGYERKQFEDAFERYLPDLSAMPRQPVTDVALGGIPIRDKKENVADEKTREAAPDKACRAVADPEAGNGKDQELEERAAILEYEAGLSREDAEAEAYRRASRGE